MLGPAGRIRVPTRSFAASVSRLSHQFHHAQKNNGRPQSRFTYYSAPPVMNEKLLGRKRYFGSLTRNQPSAPYIRPETRIDTEIGETEEQETGGDNDVERILTAIRDYESQESAASASFHTTETFNRWLEHSWLPSIEEGTDRGVNAKKVPKTTTIISPRKLLTALQSSPHQLPFPDATSYCLLLEGARRNVDQMSTRRLPPFLEDVLMNALGCRTQQSSEENRQVLFAIHKVMTSWCKAHKVRHADEWLSQMEKGELPGIQPTRDTYRLVMSGFINHQNPRQAEIVLRRMANNGIQPEHHDYAGCFNAWIKSNKAGAHQRAETLILELYNIFLEKKETDDLAIKCHTLGRMLVDLMKVWSNNRESTSGSAAERVQGIMELLLNLSDTNPSSRAEMEKPVRQGFLFTMRAWAFHRSVEDAGRIHDLWRDFYQRQGGDSFGPELLSKIYTHLMTAVANGEHLVPKSTVAQAEEWTREFESNPNWQWTAPSYHALLQVHQRAGNGPEAERTLRAMQSDGLQPTKQSFNQVMLAWNRSNTADRSAHIEALFDEVTKNERVKADNVTYTTVLSALQGMGSRGERYFHEMLALYQSTKDPLLRPVESFYTKAINLYRMPKTDAEAVKRAEEIFKYQLEDTIGGNKEAAPSMKTYQSMLNIIRQSDVLDKEARIEVITRAMKNLK